MPIQEQVTAEMPRYKCHKEVWALQIKEIKGLVLSFVDDRFSPVRVNADMLVRYNPVKGDYYVVYKEGYKSISPKTAFEEGYSLL